MERSSKSLVYARSITIYSEAKCGIDEEMAETKPSAAKELLSGCFGGIVQVLVGQPFDTVKVRLQTSSDYNGALDCVRRIRQAEGLAGFYKGTLTPLVGIGACVSVQFAALENAKRFIKSKSKSNELSFGQLFAAGSFSGLANSFLSGPIEHVRIRMQVQTGTEKVHQGPGQFIISTLKQHGIQGLYKGQNITILRELIGYGIYFSIYEKMIQRDVNRMSTPTKQASRSDIAPWRQCLYGGSSGCILWLFIYPLDVAKTRLQTDALDKANRKYSSTLHALRDLVRPAGSTMGIVPTVRNMFSGALPCIVRAFPANAATFVAYEAAMRVLNDY